MKHERADAKTKSHLGRPMTQISLRRSLLSTLVSQVWRCLHAQMGPKRLDHVALEGDNRHEGVVVRCDVPVPLFVTPTAGAALQNCPSYMEPDGRVDQLSYGGHDVGRKSILGIMSDLVHGLY